jgi:hypothetical protein
MKDKKPEFQASLTDRLNLLKENSAEKYFNAKQIF